MASSNSSSSSSSSSSTSSSSYHAIQNPLWQYSSFSNDNSIGQSSSTCPNHTHPAQPPTCQSQGWNNANHHTNLAHPPAFQSQAWNNANHHANLAQSPTFTNAIHHLSQNNPYWNNVNYHLSQDNTAETLQSHSRYSNHPSHHQINPARTPPLQFQRPSSHDPYLALQDLDSSFARFGLADMGSSLPNHPPPPPPPLPQFDNDNAYLSHLFIPQLQQHNSIELENRLRMLQFRNLSDGYSFICDCCLQRTASTSMQALHHNIRRGSTSNSVQRNPERNLLSPCPEYGGGRPSQVTPSFHNYRLESMHDDDIVRLAEDQEGCRFLHKKMEEGALSDIQMIFSAVKDHICYLMIHQLGNYFVQKLFGVCSEEQITEISLILTRKKLQLIKICLNSHGSRTVQKLLEHLTTPEQVALVISALRPGTMNLVNDVNGHHVVERCLVSFSNEYTKCLADEIADHCVAAARHQNGCCIVQKCLDCSEGEQKERLLDQIIANALTLSEDTYGNYVMQFVLDMKIPHVTASILRHLEGNYANLSVQKCSSNVVEKCLKESEEEQRTRIVRELINDPNALDIMQDPYGNYVMQRALDFSKGPIRSAIVNLVERELPALINHPYGKKVVAAMGKRL